MEQQVKHLQRELAEVSRQYEEALEHIAWLQQEREDVEKHAKALRQASVRSALMVEQVEEREQYYREEAENWARSTRDLTSEIESAGTVQQLLIPKSSPDGKLGLDISTSFQPHSQTSGDWFGFIPDLESGNLALLIGDATGHGLASALLTSAVFSAVETVRAMSAMYGTRSHVHEPGMLLSMLNRAVTAVGKQQYAMTFFAANYNAVSQQLRFANAGHCFPILISKRTGEVRASTLNAQGSQLGLTLCENPTWQQQMVTLEPDDVIFLYTDGITEAANERNRELGARRVAQWLQQLYDQPVEVMRDAISSRLSHYVGSNHIDDDVTFIIARATGKHSATSQSTT